MESKQIFISVCLFEDKEVYIQEWYHGNLKILNLHLLNLRSSFVLVLECLGSNSFDLERNVSFASNRLCVLPSFEIDLNVTESNTT